MRAGLTTWKWRRSRRHLKAADAPGHWKVNSLVENLSELYVRLCMSVVFPPQPWTAVCWEPCVCPSRHKSFSKVQMPSREFPSSKLRVVWAQNHPRRPRQHRQRTRHISISRRELFFFPICGNQVSYSSCIRRLISAIIIKAPGGIRSCHYLKKKKKLHQYHSVNTQNNMFIPSIFSVVCL